MNLEHWKTDDKDWMKQRKEEWPKIVKSLKALDDWQIKTKYHKYHKELFFKGTITITEDEAGCVPVHAYKNEVFSYANILFEMWYHPLRDKDTYQDIFDAALDKIKDPRSKVRVIEINREHLMRSQSCSGFDTEYGMMGGREELITKTFYPSDSNDDVIDFGGKNSAGDVLHLAPNPNIVFSYVFGVTNRVLCNKNNDRNPFSPGQFLWDSLDNSIDRINKAENENMFKYFYRMLYMIKYQSKEKKFAGDNKYAVALANKLKTRFDNHEFGPTLMSCWDNIDDLYEEHFGKSK